MELQFMGVDHKTYLNNAKWSSGKGVGDISTVTVDQSDDYVKNGWLPACLGVAAQ